MIEFNFQYKNTMPFVYDFRYYELAEGIYSAVFKYINYSVLDTYKSPAGIFASLGSDTEINLSHPVFTVDSIFRDTGETIISPVFFNNRRNAQDNSYVDKNLYVEIRGDNHIETAMHLFNDYRNSDTNDRLFKQTWRGEYPVDEAEQRLRFELPDKLLLQNRLSDFNVESLKNAVQDVEESVGSINSLQPAVVFDHRFLDGTVNRYLDIEEEVFSGGYYILLNDITNRLPIGGGNVSDLNYYEEHSQLDPYKQSNLQIQEQQPLASGNPLELNIDKEETASDSRAKTTLVFCDFESLARDQGLNYKDVYNFLINGKKPFELIRERELAYKDDLTINILKTEGLEKPLGGLEFDEKVYAFENPEGSNEINVDVGFTNTGKSSSIEANINKMDELKTYGNGMQFIEGVVFNPDNLKDSSIMTVDAIEKYVNGTGLVDFIDVNKNIDDWKTSIMNHIRVGFGDIGTDINSSDMVLKRDSTNAIVNDLQIIDRFAIDMFIQGSLPVVDKTKIGLQIDNSFTAGSLDPFEVFIHQAVRVKLLEKNIYRSVENHGIINLNKGYSGEVGINEELVKFYKVLKKAKPFAEFDQRIVYWLPDKILNIEDNEQLGYVTEHPELYIEGEESLGQKFREYGLIEDTEESLHKKEFTEQGNLNIDTQIFGYKPIGAPAPYSMIDMIKNTLRDARYENYIMVYDQAEDIMYLSDAHSLFKDLVDTKELIQRIFVIGEPRGTDVENNVGSVFNTEKPFRYYSTEQSVIAKERDTRTDRTGKDISNTPRPTIPENLDISYVNTPRPTGLNHMNDKFMFKELVDTYIEQKTAFGKLVEKAAHRTGIAKDICFAFNKARPAEWYKTWKFLYNKTAEINKIKRTVIYDTYWVERLSDLEYYTVDFTKFIYRGPLTMEVQDTTVYAKYNTIELRPKELDQDDQYLFVGKADNIDAMYRNIIPINTIPFKDVMTEMHKWLDIRKDIEEFNRELPVIRAEIGVEMFQQPQNVQEKKRQPFSPDNGQFLFSKDYVETVIPHYDLFVRDAAAREILLNEDIVFKRLDEDNPFFDTLSGGYDELLLPQEDFDYSVYKKSLIDKYGKPIKPVSVIDSKTFIAKLPVNHPLPEYKGIAQEFATIDAQLLKFLLEVFYKIWQQNIFKFGGMDMRQSVAKMLEYMDVFIDYRIPEMHHKQAYRVLKMLRWYGEHAIMNNAEYKIVIDYDPLKSDMHLGSLKIPHTKENFVLDTTKFILKNGTDTADSTLILHLDNPCDTTISFMVALTGGEIEVYINDEQIDTIKLSKQKYEYELAKGVNEFKLVFRNYNYGAVNIANIIVNEYVYKDIRTEYSPKVGSGNVALNEIVKRTTDYYFTIDANDEFVQRVVEGNLAIEDLVAKLIEYYNSHHANKSKGKRLTIKK